MRIMTILLIIFLAGCSSTRVEGRETTVIVVRHAEKLSGRDPGLSRRGQKRALALSSYLEQFDLKAVYTSKFRRTIETATPAATNFNIEINSNIDPRKPQMILSDIFDNHSGGVVLLVGHSNTVPAFINILFPKENMKEIDEKDFSNLFRLKLRDGTGYELEKRRY